MGWMDLRTRARLPQIGRNIQPCPGVGNRDFRVTHAIAIYMQFIGDPFNLFNHKIVSGTNTTFSAFNAPGESGCPAASTLAQATKATAARFRLLPRRLRRISG